MPNLSLFAFAKDASGVVNVRGLAYFALLIGICTGVDLAAGDDNRSVLVARANAATPAETETVPALQRRGAETAARRTMSPEPAFPPVRNSGYRVLVLMAVLSGAELPPR